MESVLMPVILISTTMSMGLSGIRERVKALNGKLQIHTAPEKRAQGEN